MVRNHTMLMQRWRNSHPPIKNMLITKERLHGVSHGLGEAGYDIRIKQDVWFAPHQRTGRMHFRYHQGDDNFGDGLGRFLRASAIEEFDMPNDLVGIVHDKSTWARKGLSVFNTVIEPGWHGFLTLELVYHGQGELYIPAGSGIAQVIFHELAAQAQYSGKYQDQADKPVDAEFQD